MRCIEKFLLATIAVPLCIAQLPPDTTPPRLVKRVQPEYSKDARKAKIEGIVVLFVTVQADGTPNDIKVMSPLGYGLDEQAIEAVRQWRFEPALKAGVPVSFFSTIDLVFSLGNRPLPRDFETIEKRRSNYNIGMHYLQGDIVPQNLAKARAEFEKSAVAGYAEARFRLAICYRDGLGTEKDPVRALAWMRLAVSKEVPDAAAEAVKIASTLSPSDIDRAQKLVEKWSTASK
jgi:TonB family protein